MMEITLENKDIVKHIKTYYGERYGVKRCKVKLITESVRDKVQEIDLFHRDNVYFNIFFRAKVSGLLPDNNGKSYKLESMISEEKVRSIVKEELSKDFEVQDLKFGYEIADDHAQPGIEIRFVKAKAKVEQKPAKQMIMNVKNK